MNIEQILGNQEQIEKLVNQSEDVSGKFISFSSQLFVYSFFPL
jgi:hypothetical protein